MKEARAEAVEKRAAMTTRRPPHPLPSHDAADLRDLRSMLAKNTAAFGGHDARAPDVLVTLFRTYTVLQGFVNECTATVGISPAETNVLLALAAASHETLSVSALSKLLVVTVAKFTGLLVGLEHNGYVNRSPDPDDARTTLVRLTPAGRRLISQFAPKLYTAYDRVLEPFSAGETQLLLMLLDRLRGHARTIAFSAQGQQKRRSRRLG